MGEETPLVTREQYIQMLIDSSFQDASEMEAGFASWCESHVPLWRTRGYDETWIRQRVESAQITRSCHRTLKARGFTMLEIREELRKAYAQYPELYDLALEREHLHPDFLRYQGNTSDFRQRYTLRVLLYETDRLTYEQYCLWKGQPVPGTDEPFFEQPDEMRVVRDLSTVEELELMLALSRYALQLLKTTNHLTHAEISALMEAYGKQLRATFFSKSGYLPEDSATPYVPVTVDGPQDHDAYYAKEYP